MTAIAPQPKPGQPPTPKPTPAPTPKKAEQPPQQPAPKPAKLPDFALIKDAIEKQTLDESASLFDRNQNPTAASRMFALGGCGLDLRRNGASALSQTQQDDAKKLKQINQFFSSKPSDDAIKTRFGLEKKSQIDTIKNGQPYQSKDQFVARLSSGDAVSGYAAWANFVAD